MTFQSPPFSAVDIWVATASDNSLVVKVPTIVPSDCILSCCYGSAPTLCDFFLLPFAVCSLPSCKRVVLLQNRNVLSFQKYSPLSWLCLFNIPPCKPLPKFSKPCFIMLYDIKSLCKIFQKTVWCMFTHTFLWNICVTLLQQRAKKADSSDRNLNYLPFGVCTFVYSFWNAQRRRPCITKPIQMGEPTSDPPITFLYQSSGNLTCCPYDCPNYQSAISRHLYYNSAYECPNLFNLYPKEYSKLFLFW